jgi:quinol monooxygenase YgiN
MLALVEIARRLAAPERGRRFIYSTRLIVRQSVFHFRTRTWHRPPMSQNTDNITHIREGAEPVTLINVFDVEPANQEQLVELLTEGTEQVFRHRPGFISVNLLTSNDGTRVVNYAQWHSLEDIKATMADPDAQGYATRAAELAQASPHVYSVASVHHA